jgi:hypothetical protein
MNADGLAFDQHRLERLDDSRCSVGARFSSTGWPLVTSSRMSQTSGDCRSIIFLARTHGVHVAQFLQAADDERLEQHQRHLLGQPHWCSFSSGPITMTERPE